MTFRADILPPPPKTESAFELYRWNYRIFELLNGIQKLLASGVILEPAPVGQIAGVTVQDMTGQIDSILEELQLGGYVPNHSIYELEKRVAELEKRISLGV